MQAPLYANLTERKLSDSLGGPDFEWPELIEGDTVRIGLRFAQTLGDEELEIERSVRVVRASLGRLATRPDDGQWAIQIGNESPEVGVNTTMLLAHDATAEDVRNAVQALLEAPGFAVPGVTAGRSKSRPGAVVAASRRAAGVLDPTVNAEDCRDPCAEFPPSCLLPSKARSARILTVPAAARVLRVSVRSHFGGQDSHGGGRGASWLR